MFSVVVFTTMKADGCTKKYAKPMKKEQIYTAAKAFVFGQAYLPVFDMKLPN